MIARLARWLGYWLPCNVSRLLILECFTLDPTDGATIAVSNINDHFDSQKNMIEFSHKANQNRHGNKSTTSEVGLLTKGTFPRNKALHTPLEDLVQTR
uniref:SFRICE_037539 n=1 Tax=Spodoptera frugiperda TaxID=7108 RepID=A0A2H1VYX2_SPOFR